MVFVTLTNHVFRGRIGSLRWIDVVAVYSPVVAIVAFIAAGSEVVLIASSYALDIDDVLDRGKRRLVEKGISE